MRNLELLEAVGDADLRIGRPHRLLDDLASQRLVNAVEDVARLAAAGLARARRRSLRHEAKFLGYLLKLKRCHEIFLELAM